MAVKASTSINYYILISSRYVKRFMRESIPCVLESINRPNRVKKTMLISVNVTVRMFMSTAFPHWLKHEIQSQWGNTVKPVCNDHLYIKIN